MDSCSSGGAPRFAEGQQVTAVGPGEERVEWRADGLGDLHDGELHGSRRAEGQTRRRWALENNRERENRPKRIWITAAQCGKSKNNICFIG